MSVDKFGRYSRKTKSLRGPKGEGFSLTPDGDYDMQRKRLRNMGEPTDALDAVNFELYAKGFLNCITRQDGLFDAQNTRITNMAPPIDNTDAVTKQYLESRSLVRLDPIKAYSLHQYRLQDVASPVYDGDAVNLNYLKTNSLVTDGYGVVDAKGSVIRNLKSPKSNQDAVNLAYIQDNAMQINAEGVFNARNTVVRNVAPPVYGSDAINKAYLDHRLPIQGNLAWNFKNKRLGQVADPSHQNDAVTVKYFKENTLQKNLDSNWDVHGNRIENLAKPLNLDDVVNKRYLKEAFADLSLALYKTMNKGKRVSMPDEAEWKARVIHETSTWDTLFMQ